jgi:hypothetical protein
MVNRIWRSRSARLALVFALSCCIDVASGFTASTLLACQSLGTGLLQTRQAGTGSSDISTRLYSQSTSSASSLSTISPSQALANIEQAIAQGQNPRTLIEAFEESNESPIPNPHRSPLYLGDWHVYWTDCPPPSNGVLGPFKGTSSQVIGGQGEYQNLLRVPPNNWLSATLDGVWEEWDGNLLQDGKLQEITSSPDPSIDYGANCWKVTFVELRIELFERFTLVKQKFPPGTSRVWRTTYLDDKAGVRIVRAGRTGRVEDEYVFYTKREPVSKL